MPEIFYIKKYTHTSASGSFDNSIICDDSGHFLRKWVHLVKTSAKNTETDTWQITSLNKDFNKDLKTIKFSARDPSLEGTGETLRFQADFLIVL